MNPIPKAKQNKTTNNNNNNKTTTTTTTVYKGKQQNPKGAMKCKYNIKTNTATIYSSKC